MGSILRGQELVEYNKKVYSAQWLNASKHRLETDYYKKDHNQDTLETLLESDGKKVLECGIGTGEFFALGLARNNRVVYGIDFSDKLLNDCKERFNKEGLIVRLGMADAQKLPFKNDVFDATYAIGVMPYIQDLNAAVNEMIRVTKKGGIILFDMMNLWHISQLINYWYRVFEANPIGFKAIYLLKKIKQSLSFKTYFKDALERVNYRLISPLEMACILNRLPVWYRVRGYNVLLPLDLPILGKITNLCERSRPFSYGLKDNKILKYFGAKLVIAIEKL
jgi:ubiquinone/menaquinone biosynthesis C-methylase UbiE